jgi:hypothetical protein
MRQENSGKKFPGDFDWGKSKSRVEGLLTGNFYVGLSAKIFHYDAV